MADNYQITGQVPHEVINPMGTGFAQVWDVGVKVTSGPSQGAEFSVRVADDMHDATHVKQIIEDKIKQLDEVASL